VYADAAAEALAKAAAEDTRGVGESYAVTMAPSPRYYINVWDYGPVCGSVQLDGGTMEAAAKDSKLTNAVKAASIRREVAKEIAEAIEEARPFVQAYAMNFVAAVRGNRPVQPLNLDDIPADMKNGFEKYRAAWAMIGGRVSALLRQEMGGTLAGDMVAEAKRLGWASSGMFYVTLSRTQAAAAELSKFSPSSTPVKVDLVDNTDLPVDLFGEKGPGAKKGVGTLEQFASVWEQYITPPPGVNTELSMAGLTESNSIEWINSKMVWALEQTVHTLKIDPFNPMAGMVSFGHTILNLFSIAIMIWMLVVGGAAAGAAIGAAGAAAAGPAGVAAGGILGGATGAVLGVLGSALAPIGFLIKMALLAILGVGIVHAYVLPMIPYIMTTFAVTGMMILTVEAMVAAPLWAWFHVRLDGQDFVDQVQKPGYMIAFNLVLRPTLIIFGLILSMGVFGASMWFINSTFLMTALTGVAGHTLGPIGILTFLVIMGYMHYQVAIRSFTLITQVPDRVTRWFGQGGENLGEENDAKHSSQFIVANVSSKFEGMARGAGARAAFGGRSSAPKGDPGNGQQGQQGQQQGQAKNEGEGL